MPQRAFDFERDARVCVDCGERARIAGRGRCKPCYDRDWKRRNPEKGAEYSARYREKHPEKRREYVQRVKPWRDPEVHEKKMRWRRETGMGVEYNRRRRALKYGTPKAERITAAEWEALKEEFGHLCAWCELPCDELTMDHVQPLVAAGAHALHNIVPACRSCNSSKRALAVPNWPPAVEG